MLHTTSYGDRGTRIAFCHGLFGQGKNWTQIGKALADEGHRVTLVDLPNHGRSPWTRIFSYAQMADALAETLQSVGGQDRWVVVGHSMGGKAVMLLTLRHPELVERLVVVDMSPVDYGGLSSFGTYVAGMTSVPVDSITARSQADESMRPYVSDTTIRAFLLQNLRRDGQRFRWQMNLDLLGRSLGLLGGWPSEDVPAGARYDGPVLWIKGERSPYVQAAYGEAMRALFPKVRLVTVKGAGHWVHSERPDVFFSTIRPFVQAQR